MIILHTNVVSEPIRQQVISVADAQIAAIATVHGFTVATRDTSPFIAAGVRVINPWEESSRTTRLRS